MVKICPDCGRPLRRGCKSFYLPGRGRCCYICDWCNKSFEAPELENVSLNRFGGESNAKNNKN